MSAPYISQVGKEAASTDSQLLSLPRGQDLTHCSGGNGYIRLVGGVLCGMLRECGPPILDLLAAFLNGNW
jgi:hypothetical protein